MSIQHNEALDLLPRLTALLRQAIAHLRLDGPRVTIAFLWRTVAARLLPPPRDPGERAAERFLCALGYAIVARNWRSPRDPRDEADLIALTPDRREIVIVEVKRAAGPWDALGRVDGRKKEVLWRLLTDVERCARGIDASVARTLPASAVRSAEHVRVDLIGVRGEGRSASVVDHDCGLFLRALRSNRATRAP
jgi:hypothetical protein